MGLSSSTKTTSYTPSPQQASAANAILSTYQGNQGNVANIDSQFNSLIPGATSTAGEATSAAGSAAGYYGDVLGGKYLSAGNPYLTSMINSTDNSIRDQVDGQFSAAGRTGSGANQYVLAKALAESENNLRYQDYNSELSRMDSAASGAGSLASSSLGSLLGLGTSAANLPMSQAQGLASGIGGLNIKGSQTDTDTPSTVTQIGKGLQIAQLLFSDRRLKTDIERVGEFADGLGQYTYRYLWDQKDMLPRRGVMADEVARLRPHALGPRIAGFATVDMAVL